MAEFTSIIYMAQPYPTVREVLLFGRSVPNPWVDDPRAKFQYVLSQINRGHNRTLSDVEYTGGELICTSALRFQI